MRRLALAAILAAPIGLGSNRAHAQAFGTIGGPVPVAPLQLEGSFPIPSHGAPRVIRGLYVPHYAYSRAPYPYPARAYSGFGPNDFPFYGRPYGPAWEPWSWSALGQYPAHPDRPHGMIGY
jgi:hypothetical protein